MELEEKRRRHREYMRDYYKKNPEIRKQAAERSKKYRQENPEKRKQWLEQNKEYIHKYNKLKNIKDKQTMEGRFTLLQRNCKSHDIVAKINCNTVTVADIRDLYDLQEGKCIYTNVDLQIDGTYQISVDRIDSTKGHTKENCQLTILPINRMKSNLSHDKFLELLENIRENSENINKFIDYDEFPINTKRKIYNLVGDVKRRSKSANIDNEINLENFKLWRKSQNDVCQLTGVPVTWEPNKWNTASIDRIDSSKGYTMDNIQLVLWPINMMKNDLTNDEALDVVNLIL